MVKVQMAASYKAVVETVQYKVVLLGEAGVGKTAFLKRYCHSNFSATTSTLKNDVFTATSN